MLTWIATVASVGPRIRRTAASVLSLVLVSTSTALGQPSETVGGEASLTMGPGIYGCGRGCTTSDLYAAWALMGGAEVVFRPINPTDAPSRIRIMKKLPFRLRYRW